MMHNDRFIYLLSRELAGEASSQELHELQQLVQESAVLQEKYRLMWQYHRRQQENNKLPNIEKSLQKVMTRIREQHAEASTNNTPARNRRFFSFKKWSVAAGIIIMVSAGIASFYLFKKSPGIVALSDVGIVSKNESWTEKQNAKGTRSSIVLSDGTKIWLNADSKLDYPQVFEGRLREVYLTGEAFFDVAKNPSKPFIIHLDNGTVRVLGTSFNIKAYKGSGVVETSVATGKVAFIPKKNDKLLETADTTFLTPEWKAVYHTVNGEVKTVSTISIEDKAWTEGKLIFKSNSFEEIALELERSFGKKVVFSDDAIKWYRLTGSFENNSLDEILYYLSRTKPFTYRVSDEEIIIGGMQ
jgi:transmembrane sensor